MIWKSVIHNKGALWKINGNATRQLNRWLKRHNGLPNFIYVILTACVSTTQKEFIGHTLLDETWHDSCEVSAKRIQFAAYDLFTVFIPDVLVLALNLNIIKMFTYRKILRSKYITHISRQLHLNMFQRMSCWNVVANCQKVKNCFESRRHFWKIFA